MAREALRVARLGAQAARSEPEASQGHRKSDGPDGGTGLGLAIAFDIAREHGGALEASSPPGKGACFVLRLPLSKEADDSRPTRSEAQPSEGRNPSASE